MLDNWQAGAARLETDYITPRSSSLPSVQSCSEEARVRPTSSDIPPHRVSMHCNDSSTRKQLYGIQIRLLLAYIGTSLDCTGPARFK